MSSLATPTTPAMAVGQSFLGNTGAAKIPGARPLGITSTATSIANSVLHPAYTPPVAEGTLTYYQQEHDRNVKADPNNIIVKDEAARQDLIARRAMQSKIGPKVSGSNSGSIMTQGEVDASGLAYAQQKLQEDSSKQYQADIDAKKKQDEVAATNQAAADQSNALAATTKQNQLQAGTDYTKAVGNILAGSNNYLNAANAQQDVVSQAALGGWTGAAGALAGQQKAGELGATQQLQDKTAQAQDIFATNSAVAAAATKSLSNEFALSKQDFDTQLGYNQQFLSNAQQMLDFASGEQKLKLQTAIDDYQNAITKYQNSSNQDSISDAESWKIWKTVVGAAVGVASVIAAVPTGGASLAGVGAGIAIASS